MERNSGFELSVLIHHIDLRDFHAWNVVISLSKARQSGQPVLGGAEHRRTERVKNSLQHLQLSQIPSEPKAPIRARTKKQSEL